MTTHIWVAADLLNHIVVEVTGVTQQAAGDVVGVLEALEDLVHHGSLTPLPQLALPLLGGQMEVLDPAVVLNGVSGGDMVLELDEVAARDLFGIDRGDDGSSVVVDGLDDSWRRRYRGRQ